MKTNETNGATLRPWKQNGGNINGKWETGQEVGIAMVGTTRFCGDEYGGPKDIRMKAEDKANAALIVQAVNEREALLAVAEAANNLSPLFDNDNALLVVYKSEIQSFQKALAALDKLTKDSVDKTMSTE